MNKPLLCLDFDGVIHSYVSGWKGADTIPDPPVPYALEWVYDALDHFRIAIYSSRSGQPGGIPAMQLWLRTWAINLLGEGRFENDPMLCWLDQIEWPTEKPPAFLTIDDRAITFDGTWPDIKALLTFKPWNK